MNKLIGNALFIICIRFLHIYVRSLMNLDLTCTVIVIIQQNIKPQILIRLFPDVVLIDYKYNMYVYFNTVYVSTEICLICLFSMHLHK